MARRDPASVSRCETAPLSREAREGLLHSNRAARSVCEYQTAPFSNRAGGGNAIQHFRISLPRGMDMVIDEYLDRIGYRGALAADLETLRCLHRAHVGSIPFENVDVQLGLPIRLEIDHLADKLVRRRRGGYCFEQNTFFMTVLRELGFEVRAFEARVRLGSAEIRPRTHMLLGVDVRGEEYLADVGFGGDGLLVPIRQDGSLSMQGTRETYRVQDQGGELVLQLRRDEEWLDLYAFVPEARPPIDFEMANYFTSTHPRSSFVKNLTAQISKWDERHVLRNRSYVVHRAGTTEERLLADDEILPLLRQRFGLELAENTQFRALGRCPGSGTAP